jgi:ABC-type multidrug transport system ATPase subunit
VDEAALRNRLGDVDLDPDLRRSARDYSQGMRQRLSLARATVHAPEVLLLDEPFSNVDATSAAHIVALLARWRDEGMTIIVVTHQPELLQAVADERVAMSAGRIENVFSLREVPA